MQGGSRAGIARPVSEADAVATRIVFLEWLRAVRRLTIADWDAWRAGAPDAFADALAAFAGLDPALGYRGNLLRRCRRRDALLFGDGGRWSLGDTLPAAVARALTGDWPALIHLAADHLLIAETRPDDRLVWHGDPADPWPYGAWLVGAVVVLPVRPPA